MTISKNMVKRTCYFTVGEWEAVQDAGERAGLSASKVLRCLVSVYLPAFVEAMEDHDA